MSENTSENRPAQADRILDGLNAEQRDAVTHGQGPLLVVAGAGTGKTTVLARRYAWLMREWNCRTENILALTFTEKSAEEMESRVLAGLPVGAYDFWISTFHGMCQRVLEEFALDIGLPNAFRVVSETDAWLMLKHRIHDLPLDYYRPLGNPTKFLRALLRHISRAKDEGVTADAYLDYAERGALDGDSEFVTGERARLAELGNVYFAYQKILRDEGCMDFGDLILETLRLLRTRPAVCETLRRRFRFVFVDEFQDTNWAQYELVKLIAGTERNVTVVGDDDQAIYKFRGASLANILQFRDDYPDARVVTLTKNYRSRQEILDAAYGSIQKNNPHRLEIKLDEIKGKKKLHAEHGSGGTVRVLWYDSMEDEARGVAHAIASMKADDPTLAWSDIAILSRSNDTAAPFVQALEAHGVPFVFSASRGLYSKPFILDVLSLLTLASDPHDARHVWRVFGMAPFHIPLDARAALLRSAARHGISLWDAVCRSRAERFAAPVQERLDRLRSGIERGGASGKHQTVAGSIRAYLEATGVLAAVLTAPDREKAEKLHLLRALSDDAERYQAAVHDGTLKSFLDDVRLAVASGDDGTLAADPDAGPDFVHVMTVHAAKGLEFRHVFCVALVDQRFPTRRRGEPIPLPDGLVPERLPDGDETHLAEERRLFYVALTRAKESLTLTGAGKYGGAREKRASVFLEELGIGMTSVPPMARFGDGDAPAAEEDARAAEARAFPLKRRFSFTQLAAFETCPKQYQFAHVYKIPIVGNEAKSFGQAVHKALHDILALHVERGASRQGDLFATSTPACTAVDGFRVTRDEAIGIYDARWHEHAFWFSSPAQKKKYYDEGGIAVRRLWQAWYESPPVVDSLEKAFTWKLGEHSIRGSVDRMDRHPEGGVFIYDYKTGHPKTSKDLGPEQKKQVHLYQLAMEAMGIVVRGLGYLYVLDGSVAEVPILLGEKKAAFAEKLLDGMNRVLASDFPANPSEIACRFCDFRDICENRKG